MEILKVNNQDYDDQKEGKNNTMNYSLYVDQRVINIIPFWKDTAEYQSQAAEIVSMVYITLLNYATFSITFSK